MSLPVIIPQFNSKGIKMFISQLVIFSLFQKKMLGSVFNHCSYFQIKNRRHKMYSTYQFKPSSQLTFCMLSVSINVINSTCAFFCNDISKCPPLKMPFRCYMYALGQYCTVKVDAALVSQNQPVFYESVVLWGVCRSTVAKLVSFHTFRVGPF